MLPFYAVFLHFCSHIPGDNATVAEDDALVKWWSSHRNAEVHNIHLSFHDELLAHYKSLPGVWVSPGLLALLARFRTLALRTLFPSSTMPCNNCIHLQLRTHTQGTWLRFDIPLVMQHSGPDMDDTIRDVVLYTGKALCTLQDAMCLNAHMDTHGAQTLRTAIASLTQIPTLCFSVTSIPATCPRY